MMQYKKRYFAFLLAILVFAAILTGCGSKSAAPYAEGISESAAYDYEMPAEEPAAEEYVRTEAESLNTSASGDADSSAPAKKKLAEKIIYTGYLHIETTDFDAAISSLEAMVTEYGGFVESSSVNGSTTYQNGVSRLVDRYASYTVRVPCEKFAEFQKRSGSIGNVLVSNTSADNITAQFTDVEARRDSLTTQEERLLALMEKAEDTESLIALESRLSEVRYEIESLARQLINWQNSVDYSTVNLDINEVELYTPVVTAQRTFGEKLRDSFLDGWNGFVEFLKNFAIWFVGALPTLVLLAVLVLLIVFLVKFCRRKAKARYEKKHPMYAKPVEPPKDQT